MPNWVYNGLTIEGKPESIDKLVEQMNKPFHKLGDNWNKDTGKMEVSTFIFTNPVFSFHNIYNHIQDGITDLEYIQQPVRSELDVDNKDWWADTQKLAQTDKGWYNWNLRNWGVKWDVAVSNDSEYPSTYMEGPTTNGENKVVYYNFETAWGIPDEAMIKLSSQYPDLLFNLSYEEETGWGGEREYLRGECISEAEYESKCKDCDAEDQMEFCEECENEICGNCNWLGEADLESVKECQTHKIYLDDNHLPIYRKVEA